MKLGFVVIYVADVKSILTFYSEAFGLAIRLEHGDNGVVLYGEMETEGAILSFASHEMGQLNLNGDYQKIEDNDRPFGQEIVFVCDDVSKAYNKAIAAGANAISPPIEKPWGQTVAYVGSIEGTLIELCSDMNAER